jgi:hypothetical protein
MKNRRGKIEQCCKAPAQAVREAAEQDQEPRQGRYEEESEEDVEQDLAIRPTGVVAWFVPALV